MDTIKDEKAYLETLRQLRKSYVEQQGFIKLQIKAKDKQIRAQEELVTSLEATQQVIDDTKISDVEYEEPAFTGVGGGLAQKQ